MSKQPGEPVEPVQPKNKGGRPRKITDPEVLLRDELLAHIILYKDIRQRVQKRLERFGDDVPAEELAKMMVLLRQGIVELSRPFLAPARSQGSAEPPAEDPAKILEALLRGER